MKKLLLALPCLLVMANAFGILPVPGQEVSARSSMMLLSEFCGLSKDVSGVGPDCIAKIKNLEYPAHLAVKTGDGKIVYATFKDSDSAGSSIGLILKFARVTNKIVYVVTSPQK